MTATHTLTTTSLALAYGRRAVIDDLDLAIPDGEITAIIGANGCGKSTLLRALARLMKPQHGEILLDGVRLRTQRMKQVARTLGFLPQAPTAPEGIVVADLVGRGRAPHQGMMARWSAHDDAVLAQALSATGLEEMADRSVDELSGGQRQRVWIAMALAQETDILLLDEPTTYLDMVTQIEVLDLLTDLNRDRGTTIVMVLHDMNMAARYASHLVAMREGQVIAAGPPAQILTRTLIRDVFGLDCVVTQDPVSGEPLVLPRGRHHVGASSPSDRDLVGAGR